MLLLAAQRYTITDISAVVLCTFVHLFCNILDADDIYIYIYRERLFYLGITLYSLFHALFADNQKKHFQETYHQHFLQ